jgi:hypothetical protein
LARDAGADGTKALADMENTSIPDKRITDWISFIDNYGFDSFEYFD